jgi:PST family polysaccharide transporter
MKTDNDRHFTTEHLQDSLKERAVKSVAFTLSAQGVKLFLQIGSIATLARLLQPEDFGLVAMVTVFTGLAMQISDGGLSMATIQRDYITQGQVSNLFWLNSALGLGLFLAGTVASPVVAMIYDEPRLVAIMVVMSSTFVIAGVSVQHNALLRRQMRFKAISIIDILSMAAGIIAGIIAATGAWGYWALVVSPIVTYLTKTIMSWLVCGWIPSWITRRSGVKPLLDFGASLTGANVIGYFVSNATSFTVGIVGGAQNLGFYNRSSTLAMLPTKQLMPPIMQVMQSVLSRVKTDPQRLKFLELSLMGKIAIVTMLIVTSMFLTADILVRLFLGEQWEGIVGIFRILLISSIATPITAFVAVVMVAVGEAKALMRWKIITFSILAASLIIGSFWGVKGIVLAHCLSGILLRMPAFLLYATSYQPVRFFEFANILFPPFFCAFVTMVSVMSIRFYYDFGENLLTAMAVNGMGALLYLSMLCLFKSMRKELWGLVDSFRVLIKRS